jgi:hypothetical protein
LASLAGWNTLARLNGWWLAQRIQHPSQLIAWKPSAASHHTSKFPDVGDVFERIPIEEQEVGSLPRLDRPPSVELVRKACGISRGCRQRFPRSQARLNEISEFITK